MMLLNFSVLFITLTCPCNGDPLIPHFYIVKTIEAQGWDKYCPAGKFQWKMPEIAGMANTLKITEVANTGIYEYS